MPFNRVISIVKSLNHAGKYLRRCLEDTLGLHLNQVSNVIMQN